MDPRSRYVGFNVNPQLNAFKNLGKSFKADTTLRLDSIGCSTPSILALKGIKRKWSTIGGSATDQQIGSSLCLGLFGHSSSSSDSKGSSGTACTSMSSAKEIDEESSMELDLDFSLHIGSEKIPIPSSKKSDSRKLDKGLAVDLELSLSSGAAESDVTTVHLLSTSPQSIMKAPRAIAGAFHTDEVSNWKASDIFHPFQTTQETKSSYFLNQAAKEIEPAPLENDISSSVITNSKSSVTCTSGLSKQLLLQQQHQQRSSSSTKQCQFNGCVKGARGASGLCIAHGGGRRCQKPGCHKGAEGRTAFCKAHGGGRRCEFLGCTKSAEGRTDFCIAHGGGRRCSQEGCTRAARGRSGLCIRHGGGKRCQKEGCTKSAEGLSGLCISHGGGRRCQYPECSKGAQGSTMFCKAHGGGKRCTFEGCNKGAEGSTPFCKGHGGGKRCSFQGGGVCPKSVHGGTLFCVAHGGGKRCAVPECTKSARGRTDFCVRHGGGKRCKVEDCGKSAQGSTDFCKAHGGGKRCSWGQPDFEFGQEDGPCNSFARGKTGLCASHDALVQDNRVHGGATLGSIMVQDLTPSQPEKMKGIVNAEDICTNFMKMQGSSAMISANASDMKYFGFKQPSVMPVGASSSAASEGRVHGGSLMALLAGGSSHTLNSSKGTVPASEPGTSFLVPPKNWM